MTALRTLLLTLLLVLGTRAGAAEPTRLLLSLGSNVGSVEDVPLHYANTDARRFRDLMVEVGHVDADRAYLLENATANAVRAAVRELKGRAAELAATGTPALVLVYVSSHQSSAQLHLHGTLLSLAELHALVDAIPAQLRMMVLDTCESGAAARSKGGMATTPFELNLTRLPLRGEVLLSSSGPAEASEEWDSLGGSLFTHHLLTGLRGDADADGDGRVSLAEAYAYAYRRTVATSARVGQHPVADIDLSGAGELILTEPTSLRSAIVFPADVSGNYVIANQPDPSITLEVDKPLGRVTRLAVPPGRYVVRKRIGTTVGLLTLELPYGGEVTLDERGMVRRRFEEVALKGGYVDLHASTLFVTGTLGTPLLAAASPRFLPGLAYRHTFGEAWLRVGASVGQARYDGVDLHIHEQSAQLLALAGWRYLGAPVIPYLGAGINGTYERQSFVRLREAEIEAVFGGGPLPVRASLGVGVTGVAGVEFPIVSGLTLALEGYGEALYLPHLDSSGTTASFALGAGGTALLGWRF